MFEIEILAPFACPVSLNAAQQRIVFVCEFSQYLFAVQMKEKDCRMRESSSSISSSSEITSEKKKIDTTATLSSEEDRDLTVSSLGSRSQLLFC